MLRVDGYLDGLYYVDWRCVWMHEAYKAILSSFTSMSSIPASILVANCQMPACPNHSAPTPALPPPDLCWQFRQ